MNKKMSRFLFLLSGIIVGAVIGGSAVYYMTTTTIRAGAELLAANYVNWETEGAYYQYKTGEIDLAEQSFMHLLQIYEGLPIAIDNDTVLADIGFTYIRLGEIASTKGQELKATGYFQLGLESYRKYCAVKGIDKEYTIESLRQLIARIDSQEPAKAPKPLSTIFSGV